MSSVCVTTPTATVTETIQTGGVITSFSTLVSTSPGTTSVSVSVGCEGGGYVSSGNSSSLAACTTTTVSRTITIDGSTFTTRVPYLITVDDVSTQLVTQYATSCSVVSPGAQPPAGGSPTPVPGPSSDPVNPPINTPSPSPTPGAPVPAPVPVTTPYVTTIVEGSTTRRSTVFPSGTVLSAQATDGVSSTSKKVSIGPIVGGVVGGVVVAGLIGFLVYYFFFKAGAGGKFGAKTSGADEEGYGHNNAVEDQAVQSQATGPSTQNNVVGNNTAQYATGGETQQQNPFQQTQETGNQYHGPGRLTSQQQQQLEHQMQQYSGASALVATGAPIAGVPSQPTGGSATSTAALGPFAGGYPATVGTPQAPYGSPSPAPTAQTHYTQSSFSHGSPTPLAPSLPQMQVQGQPQMVNYNQQAATGYVGYAEPSRGI